MIGALARVLFGSHTTTRQTPPPEMPVPFQIGQRIRYLDRVMVVTAYSYPAEYMPRCLIAHYRDTYDVLREAVFAPVSWPALEAENKR